MASTSSRAVSRRRVLKAAGAAAVGGGAAVLGGKVAVFLVAAAMIPSVAFGQASIAGVVRDTSAAVLPGVTVEAASPALIEKVRTAVTDNGGQYRIENLRPGTYTVTFTLPGFSIVKREGIELAGTFTATINVELPLSTLQETITVTGETPIVDVQNARQQRVIGQEVIDAIPTGRLGVDIAQLVPAVDYGIGSHNVGGTTNQQGGTITAHGSRGGDMRQAQNGVDVGATVNNGGSSYMAPNTIAYQEVVVDTGGNDAQMPTGGPRINMIPKDGGNTFSGGVFTNFSTSSLQSSNFNQALAASGLRTPDALKRMWDVNPGMGGPILRDRLWFFVAYRTLQSELYPAGVTRNLNANNPNVWTFAPDPNSRPFNSTANRGEYLRLTWQAREKLKLGFANDQGSYCGCTSQLSSTTAAEAAFWVKLPNQRNLLADWTSPLTSRLLVDGALVRRVQHQTREVPEGTDAAMIAVLEQSLQNFNYRNVDATVTSNVPLRKTDYDMFTMRNSLSYIPGAHDLKTGVTINWNRTRNTLTHTGIPFTYVFNRGVPVQIRMVDYPVQSVLYDLNLGLYVQDKWTYKRATVFLGARYDRYRSRFPDQRAEPTPLLPNRNLSFAATEGVVWNDITPKMNVAYDLFGNGKTALKASLNKYLEAMGDGGALGGNALNPINRVSHLNTRAWTDLNGNFVPDCDLTNPLAQNFSAQGRDICGASTNNNFGLATGSSIFDPEVLSGGGVRGFNWEFSAGIQQQLAPRVSVDVSFFRRSYGNFFVTDNQLVSPSDFAAFSVTAPAVGGLPSSGQVLGGYLDLNPNKVGFVQNYVTKASNYGEQTERWTGFDVSVSARLRPGFLVQGGTATGRRVTNTCEIQAVLPEIAPTNPFCNAMDPWATRVRVQSVYTIPRIGVQASANVQSLPGPFAPANYVAANALVQPSLGRPLSGNAVNVTVPLIPATSLYAPRVNQLDLRVGKIFRTRGVRYLAGIDVYNALNSNAALTVFNTVGGARLWQAANSIMTARFLKFSVQVDF